MTRGEAAKVAVAHLVAAAAEERRREVEVLRLAAAETATRDGAARDIARAVRCRSARAAARQLGAALLELIAEPTSGGAFLLSYLHSSSGQRFHSKPACLGSFHVQDAPAWVSLAGPSAARTTLAPSWLYHSVRAPWLQPLLEPPPGVLLCSDCSGGVATRICHGQGCADALLCFPCFIARHPRASRLRAGTAAALHAGSTVEGSKAEAAGGGGASQLGVSGSSAAGSASQRGGSGWTRALWGLSGRSGKLREAHSPGHAGANGVEPAAPQAEAPDFASHWHSFSRVPVDV